MEERKIYQLTSGEGYVVVVNENFVNVTVRRILSLHLSKGLPGRRQWAVSKVRRRSRSRHLGYICRRKPCGEAQATFPGRVLESRQCYSITIERRDSWLFGADVFPMWADSDHTHT